MNEFNNDVVPPPTHTQTAKFGMLYPGVLGSMVNRLWHVFARGYLPPETPSSRGRVAERLPITASKI